MIAQADIQGHWQRDWLRAPGFEDGATRVHWMQAGAVYADVRIPATRPDLTGATALADLPADSLAMLFRAEGFAGETDVADGICTWHRAINWHGAPDSVDAGRLAFTAEGALMEYGVHADYTERWQRRDTGPATGHVLGDGAGGLAYLVSSGAGFVFGAGQAGLPPSAGLGAALAAGEVPPGLAAQFERVHAFGHWDGDTAIATLATNPFAEDQPLLTRRPDGVIWHRLGVTGTRRDIPLTPCRKDMP